MQIQKLFKPIIANQNWTITDLQSVLPDLPSEILTINFSDNR